MYIAWCVLVKLVFWKQWFSMASKEKKWGSLSGIHFLSVFTSTIWKSELLSRLYWIIMDCHIWNTLLSSQLCLILCNPLNCSPPGYSVRGIFQVRILDWVVISSSRGSFRPKDQTPVSRVFCIAGWVFTTKPWATLEDHYHHLICWSSFLPLNALHRLCLFFVVSPIVFCYLKNNSGCV